MTLAEQLIKDYGLVRYQQPERFIGARDYEMNNRATNWYGWALYEGRFGDVYFCIKFHPEDYTFINKIDSPEHFQETLNALGIELEG